jgi:DNA adenine methylase
VTSFSPLRYPGGKQTLANVLARLIRENGLEDGTYAEAYAGGAGAALALLYREHVRKLLLNDVDPCIYAIWRGILDHTEELCKRVRDVPISINEWKRQKTVYCNSHTQSILDVGFAAFYLNRTNRSGIIKNGGPIGGHDQSGRWKIDARFNRAGLIKRIEQIALYRDRILFTNLDAIDFIMRLPSASKLFLYLDPPYYIKGTDLYLNHYSDSDHVALATFLKGCQTIKWAMTYDRAPEVEKLYRGLRRLPFTLSYSATGRRAGKELLILAKGVQLPREWRTRLPKTAITLSRAKSI